jgi:hypothetical protein
MNVEDEEKEGKQQGLSPVLSARRYAVVGHSYHVCLQPIVQSRRVIQNTMMIPYMGAYTIRHDTPRHTI